MRRPHVVSPIFICSTSLFSTPPSPEQKQILLIFFRYGNLVNLCVDFCQCIFLWVDRKLWFGSYFCIDCWFSFDYEVLIFHRNKFINIFFMDSGLCLFIKAFPNPQDYKNNFSCFLLKLL